MAIENEYLDLEEDKGFLEDTDIDEFLIKLRPLCTRIA